MPVATVQNGTTVQSVTADHLNTPRRLTSADGALLWQWPYSAFGEEQPTVAERKFASVAAVDGDLEFNLRYPGQYFDKESGLHQNGFRTYDPLTGRYTQGDPIGLLGGWNRFGYVNANPLVYADPSGLIEMNPLALMPLEGGGGGGGSLVLPVPKLPGRGASHESPSLPNSAMVCRGGTCTAENFLNGSGVTRATDGTLNGVSTQCKPGATLKELAAGFRNGQVGVTNVGNIRSAGGRVTLDGNSRNPNHATVDGLTAQQLENLFTPTVPNPIPRDMR